MTWFIQARKGFYIWGLCSFCANIYMYTWSHFTNFSIYWLTLSFDNFVSFCGFCKYKLNINDKSTNLRPFILFEFIKIRFVELIYFSCFVNEYISILHTSLRYSTPPGSSLRIILVNELVAMELPWFTSSITIIWRVVSGFVTCFPWEVFIEINHLPPACRVTF